MKTSLPSVKQVVLLISIVGSIFIFSGIYLEAATYRNNFFPNTFIDNIDVSKLSSDSAIEILQKSNNKPVPHQLNIAVDDIEVSSSSAELESYRNYEDIVGQAFRNRIHREKISMVKYFFTKKEFSSKILYKEDKLDHLINLLLEKVIIEGENPNISLKISNNENSIVVFNGTPGRTINKDTTKQDIIAKINSGDNVQTIKTEEKNSNLKEDFTKNSQTIIVAANVASTSTVLSEEQQKETIERAKLFVGEKLTLKAENRKFEIDDQTLVSLIKPLERYQENKITDLVSSWSEQVNRDPQEAKFIFDEETLEVEEFSPHKDGLKIEEKATKNVIINWLNDLVEQKMTIKNSEDQSENQEDTNNIENNNQLILEIPLKRTNPESTLKSTNNIGINEKIGFGESYYHHSIINRVHNVGITAERISLTIIKPGEEFSFNKTLGEVSSRTGFRSAYVISGGRTVLGDGGGVCQVSSTLFRSVLDAGLNVSKRLQHSYRVSYYELNSQPGFDATVYSGDVDFRFINDTEKHILIYTFVDEENRYMNIEIYGTDDGRSTEVSGYKKWDFRGPPASEYYPTTDLAPGQTKQIDWSVSGIKTEFTHTIKDKDGNVKAEDVYYSNYRPWSAKFLKGV